MFYFIKKLFGKKDDLPDENKLIDILADIDKAFDLIEDLFKKKKPKYTEGQDYNESVAHDWLSSIEPLPASFKSIEDMNYQVFHLFEMGVPPMLAISQTLNKFNVKNVDKRKPLTKILAHYLAITLEIVPTIEIIYFLNNQKIKSARAGNPVGYKKSLHSWKALKKIPYKTKSHSLAKNVIPCLDYILDVSAKINDKNTMIDVLNYCRTTKFKQYPFDHIQLAFSIADDLKEFRETNITTTPQKQVELVEKLNHIIANPIHQKYGDGSYYFYVWRQFGIVKCEKRGRYNYIYI